MRRDLHLLITNITQAGGCRWLNKMEISSRGIWEMHRSGQDIRWRWRSSNEINNNTTPPAGDSLLCHHQNQQHPHHPSTVSYGIVGWERQCWGRHPRHITIFIYIREFLGWRYLAGCAINTRVCEHHFALFRTSEGY